MFLKAEQYSALTDDAAKPDRDAAKPEAVAFDEMPKEDKIAVTVDIDPDPEQTKAAHPQTKFT